MIMHVTKVKALPSLRLKLQFSDDTRGEADLSSLIASFAPFASLADETLFLKASIEDGAVTWPNGLDVATERLYALAHKLPEPTTYEQAKDNELEMGLRELRDLSKSRQEEVAEALNITQGAVSRLERGAAEARLTTIRRYLSALGWDLEVVAKRGDKRVVLRGL